MLKKFKTQKTETWHLTNTPNWFVESLFHNVLSKCFSNFFLLTVMQIFIKVSWSWTNAYEQTSGDPLNCFNRRLQRSNRASMNHWSFFYFNSSLKGFCLGAIFQNLQLFLFWATFWHFFFFTKKLPQFTSAIGKGHLVNIFYST